MSNTIRKGEMSRRVAEVMGCSNGEGEKALNAVIESVTDAMRAGRQNRPDRLRHVRAR